MMGVAWACRPRVVEWVECLSTAPLTRGGTTVINCEMVVSSNRPSRKVKDKQIGSRFNVFKLTQARRKGPCRSTSMVSDLESLKCSEGVSNSASAWPAVSICLNITSPRGCIVNTIQLFDLGSPICASDITPVLYVRKKKSGHYRADQHHDENT